MPRPTRPKDTAGTWHVMARGNRGQFIFERPADNRYFLRLLGETLDLFGWRCLTWCLMSNHYHLLIHTPRPNLTQGMRHLNSRFAQYSNHVYQRYGHLFHDRFKAEFGDTDEYCMTLIRYITLNPVRAEIVSHPKDYPWTSWHDVAGRMSGDRSWFRREDCLSVFGENSARASLTYKRFILANLPEPPDELGEIDRQLHSMAADMPLLQGTGKRTYDSPEPSDDLSELVAAGVNRDDAICQAWQTGQYTFTEIGEVLGCHRTTVSRIVRDRVSSQAGQ